MAAQYKKFWNYKSITQTQKPLMVYFYNIPNNKFLRTLTPNFLTLPQFPF